MRRSDCDFVTAFGPVAAPELLVCRTVLGTEGAGDGWTGKNDRIHIGSFLLLGVAYQR